MKYKEFDSAAEVFDMLARVRGHNMAKAGLETAIWDAEAKQKNVPLAKLLGGTRDEISSRRFHRHPTGHPDARSRKLKKN